MNVALHQVKRPIKRVYYKKKGLDLGKFKLQHTYLAPQTFTYYICNMKKKIVFKGFLPLKYLNVCNLSLCRTCEMLAFYHLCNPALLFAPMQETSPCNLFFSISCASLNSGNDRQLGDFILDASASSIFRSSQLPFPEGLLCARCCVGIFKIPHLQPL